MNELLVFLGSYGWQLALIALVGIIILGVLKYANAFKNISKEYRKPIYFAISIGFSIIASVIYLYFMKQLEIEYFITIALAIYALNQTFYAIYETTKLRDLIVGILDFIKALIAKAKETNKTE